jgi:hypothetical protein
LTDLSDAERTEVRRYCGYPARGTAPFGFLGWRLYEAYAFLEYRLDHITDSERAVIRRYLATLGGLEAAIPRSADGLDTDQAAAWTRNKNEFCDRIRLFDDWRRRLCGFLGVPNGPALTAGAPALVV